MPSDVIVLGLGAMGSAAAAWLAERGFRVLAYDAFIPPHSNGSSHGLSRIYRQAYWEDPRYVHLLLRARELWTKLERDSGVPLLHITGALMIGPPTGQLVPRSAESARQFHLPHEILSAADLRSRWPQFHVSDDTIALFEHNAGYLVPEPCIEQQLRRAARYGAELHFNEPVIDFNADPSGVTVRTARGSFTAAHLVITAGPWAPQILAEAQLPLRVTRQVLFWFQPTGSVDAFRQDRIPIYMWETGPGDRMLYGFPLTGADNEGVKVALHGSDETGTPESIDRNIRPDDEQRIRRRLGTTLPALSGSILRAETCLYTMTPDEHFLIGPHPQNPAITLALGFSGHGFKFAPVIGELIGQLVTEGKTTQDIAMFSPARFTRPDLSS
ncbi:MAG TPA: N-methyl-L-tryptophan oxidase [Acidobacteriaceae bacterium]|jgi:sarcosine oxidase|nr:N-methyl-L-tryptophan oxidase [Acidobacteriaceae bacterium]